MQLARAMQSLLCRFASARPRHVVSQARGLEWLARAHTESEATANKLDDRSRAEMLERMQRVIARCACSPEKIGWRGHSLGELDGFDFTDHGLYPLRRDPRGAGSGARTQEFARIVDDYFERSYRDETRGPDDLIHVTCTGYVSPSGAQKLVARRGWGQTTRVTHAYQMGCYAAVPAIQIGGGMLATGARRVDVAHTELCTLHLDPSDHSLEQLVVQSLFADGFVRYSMQPDDGSPGLRVLSVHEELLPDSEHAMAWTVGDTGMHMTLARDVPQRITAVLRSFVTKLFDKAGSSISALRGCVAAVHPGGPKIIDGVREVLELDEAQVSASRAVLFEYGNMSSATLPHIWMRILEDASTPRGTLVPSLAFGPGLTVCGALLEKA